MNLYVNRHNHSSSLFLDIGRSIKLSSPRLNNMAAVGCGLVYGAVILLGLDDATLPDSDGYYPTVCKVINIYYGEYYRARCCDQ